MQNLITSFKQFNNKHKKLVPFVIYFEMAAIIIASVIKNFFKNKKFVAMIAMIAIILTAGYWSIRDLQKTKVVETHDDREIVETISVEEIKEKPEEKYESKDLSEADTVELSNDLASDIVAEEQSANLIADNSSDENATSEVELAADDTETASCDSKNSFLTLIAKNPETVGWIQFEDDRLSYPIMQAGDNSKYAIKDFEGNDSDTGALFLDYRSAADFSDANSIIYGHNMRNRTMFGALKIYKENLDFLEDHKYFTITTLEGSKRYMIFAFMDVPKDSYIYDVCGPQPDNMREFLDTIEYRTWIDTGIEPTVDDKIITLSTCTQKDQLYFVMFAVEV